MPYFNHNSAEIFYEMHGTGEPLIALHGLSMNNLYWDLCGLTDTLKERFTFIPVEMRGHGRTRVNSGNPEFTAEAISEDIQALCRHLGFTRYHLMGHSTGGMVATRMTRIFSEDIQSLVLMNSSSATAFGPANPEAWENFIDKFARNFEKNSWDEMLIQLRKNPFPFFLGYAHHHDPESLWEATEKIFRGNDNRELARFARSFYRDHDHHIEELRNFNLPCLIITGEYDSIMSGAMKTLAEEIPEAEFIEITGVGHCSALEAPEAVTAEVLKFYSRLC